MVRAEEEARALEDELREVKKKGKLNPVLNQIISGDRLEKVLGYLAHEGLL